MKASFRLILAALAATVALAGCVQEITPPNFENDKVNPEGSRIIAVSFAPQTKTTLDGFQPRFEDGKDTVLISNTNALDTCVVSVDDKTGKATISTNLTGPLTAVYPYKAAKMSEGNENEIDTVLVSTVQSGKFADANICMAKMKDGKDESLSFDNKTAVFCIYPPTDNPEYVEVSAKNSNIANNVLTGSTHTSLETIHVSTTTADSVYVSILVPEVLKVGDLTFSDGTNEKSVTTGATADKEIAAGTLYTVTATDWKSPEADIPEPLKGVFTVSDGGTPTDTTDDLKVRFSKGNLYYDGSAFKFEANQYDVQSSWNTSLVSHFHWSKTASVAYAENYSETSTSEDDVFFTNATETTANANFTVNGVTGKYRTLSTAEWQYLFNTRSNASSLYKYGVTVCGKANCVVLLPDNWNWSQNGVGDNWQNEYPETQTNNEVTWEVMEQAGAVCLPAAGGRYSSFVSRVGDDGNYWSSTPDDVEAYYVCFNSGIVYPGSNISRSLGSSVRLVTDVSTTPTPAPTVPEGFVDLGVKDADGNPVYWAERNLGASKPEEHGTYFSWGETGEGRSAATLEINAFTTKPFGWDQDVFGQTFNNGISQSEACPSGVLAQAYDAAYQTNSVWRMPTKEDFTDLAKQCFLEWTDNYKGTTNVKGVIVWKAKDGDAGWFKPSASGKGCKIEDDGSGYKDSETHTFSNAYAIGTDSHVFFPAAGIGHGSDLVGASDGGYYWSSSLYTDNTDNAYSLIFGSGNVYPLGYFARYYGFSVRPVSDL